MLTWLVPRLEPADLGLADRQRTDRLSEATVVVSGPDLPAGIEADEVVAVARRGGVVVVLGAPQDPHGPFAAALGLHGVASVPAPEVFAVAVNPEHPVFARVDPEFPVAGAFQELAPGAAWRTLMVTSIAFRDRPALAVRHEGEGLVVACGLGLGTGSWGRDERGLALVLRRLVDRVDLRPVGRPLGVAVVGYGPFGGMGQLHGRAADGTAGLRFVAAVDNVDERRKAAEAEFAGIATYADAAALADDDEVDVVVVATPPSSHASLARLMLAAGKHVVVEKPLCLTVEEADGILGEAAASGRVVTVHQNRRWDPDFATIRREVEAGSLGSLFNLATFIGGFEHPCREWHSERSISGGAIYDWGSHHLDWILLLMAAGNGALPRTVQAVGHKRVWLDVTNLDQVRVRLLWDDGREAEFFQSDIAAVRPPKFTVQGTRGTIVGHYRPVVADHVHVPTGYVDGHLHHAEAPADLRLVRYEGLAGLSETHLPLTPPAVHPFHRNLADHLHLGEPLAVDPLSVRRVIGVMQAAEQSCDEGGRVLDLREVLGA
jgi:predicted dehydrogenase